MAENFTVVLQGRYLDPQIPYALYVFDVTVNVLSSVITLIGNTLVILALRKIRTRRVHNVFKAFLFNLALADLGVGLLVQPLYILAVLTAMGGYHDASRILGTAFYLVNWYFPPISVSFLTAIAIDRFLALHLGVRYRNFVTLKRIVRALVFLWIIRFAETLIIIFDHRIFNITTNAGLGVCLLLITICYMKIYLTLRHQDNIVRVPPLQTVHVSGRRDFTSVRISNFNLVKYKRSVYTMLFVYVACILFYLPPLGFFITIQIRGVDKATKIARFLGATSIFINSSLNPLLYCWRIGEIRRMVRTTLSEIFC